jgi:hypothetical protein
MKRMLGIAAMALGLVATGAFLSTFIQNPFASSSPQTLSTYPSDQTPVLVNTAGAQISVLPSATNDGRVNPVVINVGTGTTPRIYDNGQARPRPAVYRRRPTPTTQAGYEPTIHPQEVGMANEEPVTVESKQRTWQEEALIIGGSTAAGAGIGALAGGKKGAVIGAASGGVAGLVYDLATRKK